MAGAITVRELVTRWGFKTDTAAVEKFNKQIDGVKRAAKIATGAVIALGAAASGITMAFAKSGDEIAKTSRALGIAADEFQRLVYATQIGGASQQEAVVGIRTLSRAINEASQGVAEYKDNFDLLGVAVVDANGDIRPTMDIVSDISDGFAQMENGARKTAIAQELFGRSGYKMINVLSTGAEGFKKVLNEADEYGAVLGGDLLDASEVWQDETLRVRTLVKSLGATMATTLLPALLDVAGGIKEWLGGNRELMAQNIKEWTQKAIDAAKALFDWIGDVKDAINEMVDDFGGWGEVWEHTKKILKAIVLIKLAGFIWAAVAAIKGLTLAVSVNPLGLLLVTIAAILAYKDELQDMFVGAFDGWADIVDNVIDGLYTLVEGALNLFNKLARGVAKVMLATDQLSYAEYNAEIQELGEVKLERPKIGRLPDYGETRDTPYTGEPAAAPAKPDAAPAKPTISKAKIAELVAMAKQQTNFAPASSNAEIIRLGMAGQLAGSKIDVTSNLTINVPPGTGVDQANELVRVLRPMVQKELEAAARNVQANEETR
jgi:hypothetical protein